MLFVKHSKSHVERHQTNKIRKQHVLIYSGSWKKTWRNVTSPPVLNKIKLPKIKLKFYFNTLRLCSAPYYSVHV